jgi:hypothetical protein
LDDGAVVEQVDESLILIDLGRPGECCEGCDARRDWECDDPAPFGAGDD